MIRKTVLLLAMLAAAPTFAEVSNTANSGSVAGSTAVSGSVSQSNTGAATAGNSQTVNVEAPSGVVRYAGSHTIRSTPDTTLIVPGMTAPCVISVGASGSGVGFGIGIAGGMEDKDCTAREDARTLLSIGLKDEAIARLCLRADMAKALGPRCAAPVTQPAGYVVTYDKGTRTTRVTSGGFVH